MKETTYHYHAELECGHRVAFDSLDDLLTKATSMGAKDMSVLMACADCGGAERSSVELWPGGENVVMCETCGKGQETT